MEKGQPRKILSELLASHSSSVSFTKHCLVEMKNDQLITGDLFNVLRGGKILTDAEFENGQWRYRIQTTKMIVVIAFANPKKVRCITTWRK